MEQWIVFAKGITVVYCILQYIDLLKINYRNLVLFFLLYICINLIFHITKIPVLRKFMLLLSIMLCVYVYKNSIDFFILLIPLNICEAVDIFLKSWRINFVVNGLIIYWIHPHLRTIYFLATAFSCLIYYLCKKADERIDSICAQNEELRVNNLAYTQRIARKNEHYSQAVYMSQLEERNAIAQRIHDSIGHTLAGSLMQLEASKLLMTADAEKAASIIQNVIDVLREGMENIRLTLRTIKPQAEQIGINRVKLALDEFAICGIGTKLTYNGDLNRINHLMWKVILENLNEALTNVSKYSEAYEVNVKIEVLNKVVKINIKDNGIGIRNFNGNIKKGLGILGMEERTSELGGKIIIDGSDGFSIIMLLPLGGSFDGNKTADSR